MTELSRGDVALVRTRLPGQEQDSLRPALVVSSQTYQQGRGQVALLAITGGSRGLLPGDTVVHWWKEAGLLAPSVATGVLLTVAASSVERRLGALAPGDLRAVEASLRLSLDL